MTDGWPVIFKTFGCLDQLIIFARYVSGRCKLEGSRLRFRDAYLGSNDDCVVLGSANFSVVILMR